MSAFTLTAKFRIQVIRVVFLQRSLKKHIYFLNTVLCLVEILDTFTYSKQ